jgi:hypothetical protein
MNDAHKTPSSTPPPPALLGVRASRLFFTTMIAALQDARILAAYAAQSVPDAWRTWEDTVKQRIEFGAAWLRVGLSVVDEIAIECAKWSRDQSVEEDDRISPEHWVKMIVVDAKRATRVDTFDRNFRSQMVKVAALAIQAIEAHDRAKMRRDSPELASAGARGAS